jgi:DNA-binding Lrp family transcriptional regulator
MEEILNDVRCADGVQALYELPARRTFKIRVNFDFGMAADEATAPAGGTGASTTQALSLDAADRAIIAHTCGDIGTDEQPFACLAGDTGLAEEEVLCRLKRLQAAGALRRFGAILRHQQAGVAANGMAVWDIPAGRVEDAGGLMAAHPEVSHCYERPRLPDWPYNMYAMIHDRTERACRAVARQITAETGAEASDLLFSLREFKKTSMVYMREALAADRQAARPRGGRGVSVG